MKVLKLSVRESSCPYRKSQQSIEW